MSQALPPIRRIVSGETNAGGVVIAQGVPDLARQVGEGVVATHLWATAAAPAPLAPEDDGKALLDGSPPPPGGSKAGVIDIEPGAQAGPLHRTDTTDYVVCLFGEIDLVLSGESRRLSAGDVVVQCGATHTWRNPGETPARLLYVMVDALPKREGSLRRAQSV